MTLAYAYRYFDRVRRRAWKPGIYLEYEYGSVKCFLINPYKTGNKRRVEVTKIDISDAVATDWEEYYDEKQEGGTR